MKYLFGVAILFAGTAAWTASAAASPLLSSVSADLPFAAATIDRPLADATAPVDIGTKIIALPSRDSVATTADAPARTATRTHGIRASNIY